MNCPKCGSDDTIAHTDRELRAEYRLLQQCEECGHAWETEWDEDEDDTDDEAVEEE
jgi:uncharacterized Zn finger protein